MIFEQIAIGGDRNFAYLIADEATREAAVVDVGFNADLIVTRLRHLDLKLKYILVTHSHYDHIDAIPDLKKQVDAPVAGHKSIKGVQIPLDDHDTLKLGDGIIVRAVFCPGHCADSMAYIINDDKIITGDELFVGKIGGTSASEPQARQQFESLHQKLMTLADHLEVCPGHDVGTTTTSTIGRERKTNPFLLQKTFEEFLHLKNNWQAYKAKHGIK